MDDPKREFNSGDIIVCIGCEERWVVWDVGPWGYEVRKLNAFLDDAVTVDDRRGEWGGVSHVVARYDYVKVGEWDFKEEVADYGE